MQNKLSLSARVVVIIQLCIVFMMALWYISYPYMGQHFTYRSKIFLIKNILGSQELAAFVPEDARQEALEKLQRNSLRFNELPQDKQKEVKQDLSWFNDKMKEGWWERTEKSFYLFTQELPPLKVAWIIIAGLISILILLRTPGSDGAAWLLPMIALSYLIFNHWYAEPPKPSVEEALYPSEQELAERFLGKSSITSLQDFEIAWESYLIHEWAKDEKAPFPKEKGEYALNLATLEALRERPGYDTEQNFKTKEPMPLLIAYFFWNLLFAYVVNKRKT